MKKTKQNTYEKIVVIDWVDSKGVTGSWEYLDEIDEMKPSLCISVGYLLNDKKQYKEICQSINKSSPDKQVIGRMVIPTCSIKKIKKL